MKKDNLILIIIGLLLLAGMLLTILFGGERSRHGVGILLDAPLKQHSPGDRFPSIVVRFVERQICPLKQNLIYVKARPVSLK